MRTKTLMEKALVSHFPPLSSSPLLCPGVCCKAIPLPHGISERLSYFREGSWIEPGCLAAFIIIFFKFIYLERESGGGAERERERIPSRLRAVSAEPDAGRELTHREITI